MGARGESRYVSVDEWRSLNRDAQTVRYEYIDGRIYMMAGGTANHSRISINVVRAIEDALGDSPCNIYNSDLSVRLSETRYTLPDAYVTCSEQDQGEIDMVLSPKVIVEVLSESTEAYDRGKKFAFYRQCPTIEEYVLISTDNQTVEVFHRTAESWMEYHARVYGPGDMVELVSLNIHFPLDVLYRRTTVRQTLNEVHEIGELESEKEIR